MKLEDEEAIEWGWMALHFGPVDKVHRRKDCQCDPETGAVPCEYCALYEALKAADKRGEEIRHLRRLEDIESDLYDALCNTERGADE